MKESKFIIILGPYPPEMHKIGRTVDHVNCKTPFLCFRADSGNFVVLVSHTVIFLPSSRTEPASRKPIGARRDSLLHAEGVAHG